MSAVADNIQTTLPDPLVFTDSAAAKVADLIAEEGNPDLKLRGYSIDQGGVRARQIISRLSRAAAGAANASA